MELGDGCPGSANEAKKLDGERSEVVEEMAKLKEEGTKTSGDQVEKSKGFGLKKWKRRRRDLNKEAGGHAQESHRMLKRGFSAAGKSSISRGQLRGNPVKNEGSASSAGNVAASSVHGSARPGSLSDSGSRNAVVAMFPLEAAFGHGEGEGSKSSTAASLPKGKCQNSVEEERPNETEYGFGKEANCRPVDEIGAPIEDLGNRKPDLRASEHGDAKSVAEYAKKARAEKTEGSNADSEDPAPEHVVNSAHGESAVNGCEGNRFEDAYASCVFGAGKEANNSDELGDVLWIVSDKLGTSKIGALGRGKAMLAKRGSFASLNNGRWLRDDPRPLHGHLDPECGSCARENSEEAQNFDSDEKGSTSFDRFREGEEVRENSVSGCEDVAYSNESFAPAVNSSGKKRDEMGDSGRPAYSVNLRPTGSECLVQALAQVQTARNALEKEVQQIKDIGKGIPVPGISDTESSTGLPSDVETKHLCEAVQHVMSNGAHPKEEGNMNWPSWEGQLSKLNKKLELLQMELETAHQKLLAEKAKVQTLEVLCADQAVKLKNIELPSEQTASKLQSLQIKYQEVEAELEEQYKEKLQSEIEFLILAKAAENDITLVENEACIVKDQKNLIVEQLQTALKLKDAEGRALALKDQIKELENICGSLSEMEEVLTLHNKVCGFSLWSFVQFILLCFAILFMFAQSSQKTPELVPT